MKNIPFELGFIIVISIMFLFTYAMAKLGE